MCKGEIQERHRYKKGEEVNGARRIWNEKFIEQQHKKKNVWIVDSRVLEYDKMMLSIYWSK